jgi:monoterpene epsilon-lactone hydrolase
MPEEGQPSAEFTRLLEVMVRSRLSLADRDRPTIAARRSFMDRYLDFVAPDLDGSDFRREPVDAGGVRAEWCIPSGWNEDNVVVHVHGGGFVMGSPDSHFELAGRLARSAGAAALVIDYRLAPENPWPAAVDDVITSYRWLLADPRFRPRSVAVAADSAGGAIALSTLINLHREREPMPAGVALMSPWLRLDLATAEQADDPVLDLEEMSEFAAMYAGALSRDDPQVSPLYGDLSGLPPIAIHVGSREAIKGDSVQLARSAVARGVEVEFAMWFGMVHGWQMAPQVPEAVASTEKLGAFLAECFGGG